MTVRYVAQAAGDAGLDPCLFKKHFISTTAFCGSKEAQITQEEWAKQCFVFYANRHTYNKNDTAFVPYWQQHKLKSHIAIQRFMDMRGYWQVVSAFLESVFIGLGITMANDTVFHFLWIMELALMARAYCNVPAIYGRTYPTSGDYRVDQTAFITKAACGLKVPPAIAAYIDCLGTFIDENKCPVALYPQWDTAANTLTSWMIIAYAAATDFTAAGLAGRGTVRPFLGTSGALTVAVRGVTWNSTLQTAFTAANVTCPVWPQGNLDVLTKVIYKDIIKNTGGADIFVSISDKLELAGRCTSAICDAASTLNAGASSINNGGIWQYTKNLLVSRVGSQTPLVGTELSKAAYYCYMSDPSSDRTQKAKYQQTIDDYEQVKIDMSRIISDTMQLDGSYQQELAKRKASSSKKQFIEVPGAGLIPAPVKDIAMDLMDEVLAQGSALLGNVVGDDAADAIIKVGKKAVPALGKAGLSILGDYLAPGLGSFLFA
jgi:hypothetical protein